MSPTVKIFPFGPGLHEENDQRLQVSGNPRAIENLVRTKNGRLQMRRDYETLAMTASGENQGSTESITSLQLYDLLAFGDRLLGIGAGTWSPRTAGITNYAAELFTFSSQGSSAWRRAEQPTLSPVVHLRNVGAVVRQAGSVTRYDVAAGAGRVCLVFETSSTVVVHIVDAATNTTLYATQIASRVMPRAVFCGSSFFITFVEAATGEVFLRRFTPGTDTQLVSLTSISAAIAPIIAYDLSVSYEGTTFWAAFARSTSTTAMRGMDSSGTITYSQAGPAVLCKAISIFTHATVAATQRFHLALVRDADDLVNLYTYVPPSGAATTTSLDAFSGDTSDSQVTMTLDDKTSGTASLLFVWQSHETIGSVTYDTIPTAIVAISTMLPSGVSGASSARVGSVGSKLINSSSVVAFGALYQEGEDQLSSHLLHLPRSTILPSVSLRLTPRPCAVLDRLIAGAPDPYHLPSAYRDSSSGLTYWPRLNKVVTGEQQPQVSEFVAAPTSRRQSAVLGDTLYISGGILHAFDGRCVAEAGGFLGAPFINGLVGGIGGGSMAPDSIHQVVSVAEIYDSHGNRIQSSPSNVAEHTVGPTENTIVVRSSFSPTFWDINDAEPASRMVRGFMTVSIYCTQDTNDGSIAFHLAVNDNVNQPSLGASVESIIKDDDDLGDEAIVYSQGARGVLSGPLPFVCPDPCTTLAASAERMLSGGLPRQSAIQESRPLFVGEQVNWNDGIGFYRDIRGRILAVARLDERRIIFSDDEVFEADGPGLDDNGLGDIGAPRRLPSEVGLYGGVLGWRSIVETSAGLFFQGLADQIYLLPRGGVTPVAIGSSIEDTLASYPDIAAAVYLPDDQTIRFCCNNTGGTESVVLLFDIRFGEWYIEGPYAFAIRSACKVNHQFHMLTSANTVLRQLTTDTPSTFISNAWRSGVIHPFGASMFGMVYAVWFYSSYQGDCRIRCVVRYDEGDPVYSEWFDVFAMTAGQQYARRFEFEQMKCESIKVDFEVIALQGQATKGLHYTYWGLEQEPSGVPNQVAPEQMN